jgi:glycerol kinase
VKLKQFLFHKSNLPSIPRVRYGWVEHDAEEIYQKVIETIQEAILKKGAAIASAIENHVMNVSDVESFIDIDKSFEPDMSMEEREKMFKMYAKAVERVKNWEV